MLVQIRLRGTTGFLMNKRTPRSGVAIPGGRRVDETAYRDDEGLLYIPASAIKGVLVDATDRHEFVRRGITAERISAGISVRGDKVPLFEPDGLTRLKTYRMARIRQVRHPAVGAHDRVVPCAPDWTTVFYLEVRDERLSLEDLHDLFEVGGRDYGVGFRRPEYGTFEVEYVRLLLDASKGAA
jgi:hypothetical protein